MFETGRRSAISTSELGLYSDRGDRYNRNKYGPVVRKFVIVVMAVVAIILAAIFIYDFASGASATSKVSQETKHIYILQNSLKKLAGSPKKQFGSTTISPEANRTSDFRIQDRSDDADPLGLTFVNNDKTTSESGESRSPRTMEEIPESRSQSLENFKLRKRLTETIDAKEQVEGKQLFNNHAVVYRVRQRYQYPDPEEEFHEEESRPAPFHFQLKTPQPTSFNKRPKFPQLTQYRYPHTSRNIQDIIKYLTNNPNAPNRGIKFTGVYVNPKKYDLLPEVGELMANSDRNEYQSDGEQNDQDDDDDDNYDEEEFSESSRFAVAGDPFYQYKPKHPTDVNLLAPSNLRFSPSGIHRYNPYHDPFFQRPPMSYAKPIMPQITIPETSQYGDNTAAYSNGNYGNYGNYGKKKKPKPFSVMLDIYPITDLNEQPSNKISRPRIPPMDDYDPRRPGTYNRGPRPHYPGLLPQQAQSIPLVAIPAGQTGLSEEDERQQMIFHLNLYPRKKNKFNRNDIIQRSGSMRPEDHLKFMHSVMSPFDAITKQLTDHTAIEESKYEESELPEASEPSSANYRPKYTEMENENGEQQSMENVEKVIEDEKTLTFPSDEKIVENIETNNEESIKDEKNLYQDDECKNCHNSKRTKKILNETKDIDTAEGFQAFADGLMATDRRK